MDGRGVVISLGKTNYLIDQLTLFLVSIVLLVDIVNGFLLFNNINFPVSISQIYKAILLSLMLLRIFSSSHINFKIVISFLLLIFALIIYIHFIRQINFSYLKQDIETVLKLLMVPISYFYFCVLHSVRQASFIKTLIKLFFLNFCIISISLILGFFGYGLPQYAGDTGSRGFFYAGNELSVLIIVISSVLAFFIWNRKNKYAYILFGLILLVVVIIKATKTSIIGAVLVLILIPVINRRITFSRITSFNIKHVLGFFLIMPIAFYILYQGIQKVGLNERFAFFYEKLDLITFILSRRNEFLMTALSIYQKYYDFLDLLFGKGVGSFLDHMAFVYSQPKSIEIDPFDIFFYFGLIGFLVISFFWGYILLFSIFRLQNRLYQYAPIIVFLNIFLLFISFTAGHAMFSGLAGIFIAYANSISFKPTDH